MADPAPVAPKGSILDLIALLGKLGGNLPAFMAFFQTVISAWQTLQGAINPHTVGKLMASAPLTNEEAKAVDALHNQLKPHLLALAPNPAGHPVMVFGDGHIFAGLFAFIKANPWLLQLLMGFAGGLVPKAA